MSAIKSICVGVGAVFIFFWLLGSINALDVRLYIGPVTEVKP